MAAKHKQRQAGNSYNLRNQAELPIKVQGETDSTLLNEFSLQPSAGQVLSSSKSSGNDINSSDTDSQTKVKRFKANSSERVFQSKQGSDMSDQTCINDRLMQ